MNVPCPECGAEMVLKRTGKYTTRDGKPRLFYSCPHFPKCRGSHGAHPDGRPMGVPGDEETKALRHQVHVALEALWGPWDAMTGREKRIMYAWLQKYAPKPHVSEMTAADCRLFLTTLDELRRIAKEKARHEQGSRYR